jgi:hypothetical protein
MNKGTASIINAATATFGQGGYQYLLGGKAGDANRDGLKEVDYSFLVGTALKQAGVVTGVAVHSFNTQTLFNGKVTTDLAKVRFHEIDPRQVLVPNTLKPGDLIMWKSTGGSGQHIGIFDHYDAQGGAVFFGSQSSTGPAFATIGGDTGKTWTGGAFAIVGALRAKSEFYVPEFDQTGAPDTGIATPRVAALVNLLKAEGVEGYRPGIYSGDGRGNGDSIPTFGNGFALLARDGNGIYKVLPEADIKASLKLAGMSENRYDELPISNSQKSADLLNQGKKSEAIAVFGVELFVKGNDVWFSEVSPRPHDTGMVTMCTQVQTQFELHARAILGLPVNTTLRTPGASAVIYGGVEAKGIVFDGVADALRVPNTDIRLFGKPESFVKRRMGVALAFDADVEVARVTAKKAAGMVKPRVA